MKIKKFYSYNKLTCNSSKALKTQIKNFYNLIYQYHIRNKKIFFLNVPLFKIQTLKAIKKQTQHIFVPQNFWINGFISNKSTCFYSVLKKKSKKKKFETFFKSTK